MKQLAVLSGKGGTGKTTVVASLAVLAHQAIVVDCDVDAPDLHLLLEPTVIKAQEFKGSKLAVIDETKCLKCGLCLEGCRFNAIKENIEVDPFACDGCGVCEVICRQGAITLRERVAGQAFVSRTKYGFMAHALLSPGQANSGKLVTLTRLFARILAEKEKSPLLIIDGPPGIGCPVIASVTGVDVGLIVTEPTMSGIHDLKRALELLKHFSIPAFVCVNKYDINEENAKKIVGFCRINNLEFIGKIPFNPIVTEAMLQEKPVVEFAPESDIAEEINKIWENLRLRLSL
ncbi:MAG: P-loop NTPase [Caldiserica bacterium]|jgi:MinD superfamily P-loop ATPase|nr:P-loop NTPase [Caldisericota bacterium]MDH7562299.1 P-loop NTPase [Caldisericota bacterium]